jgi:hypothetical protein
LGKYPFPVGVADDGSIHIITEKWLLRFS